MDETPATLPEAPAKPKKTFWEILLTTTPVVLTVIGTVLAGLSGSEMTLAQYFRTLAAQSQSKAGDQWQFFQVKRIRGTTLKTTLDLMPAPAAPGSFEPALVLAQSGRLTARFQQALRAAEQLGMGKQETGAALKSAAASGLNEVQKSSEQLREELAKPETRSAVQWVHDGKLPPVEIRKVSDPAILEGMKALEATPEEIASLLTRFTTEGLDQARATIDLNYRDVENSTRPMAAALERIEKLTNRQASQVRAFHLSLLTTENALAKELADNAKLPQELAELQRLDRDLLATATELIQAIAAAQHFYTALRYRAEADYNMQAAQIYELQVRKLGVTSDRHRGRSRFFFYAMLAAQAGVAIASLSLAGKNSGVLWTISIVAGLFAGSFSAYVYVFV